MIGGPPAWAMKLVKPEQVTMTPPSHRGGGWLSGRGGQIRRCARKARVDTPTNPATNRESSSLNVSSPMRMPSSPKGSMKRSKALS